MYHVSTVTLLALFLWLAYFAPCTFLKGSLCMKYKKQKCSGQNVGKLNTKMDQKGVAED